MSDDPWRGRNATSLPIGGPYGTVAICIIDTITDSPMPVVQFNAAGAPLGRVTADGFETPTESCSFQRILKHDGSGSVQSWSVQAKCADQQGTHGRTLLVSRGSDRSVTVKGTDGESLITADLCATPYAERVARELNRISPGNKPP